MIAHYELGKLGPYEGLSLSLIVNQSKPSLKHMKCDFLATGWVVIDNNNDNNNNTLFKFATYVKYVKTAWINLITKKTSTQSRSKN